MAYNSRLQRNGGHQGVYKFDNNATATVIGVIGTYTKVLGNTTSLLLQNFTHTNNRLTYVNNTSGSKNFYFNVNASLSAANNNQDIRITVAKNGVALTDFKIQQRLLTAGVAQNIGTQGIVSLQNGDYVEIQIANQSGLSSITLINGTLMIQETL